MNAGAGIYAGLSETASAGCSIGMDYKGTWIVEGMECKAFPQRDHTGARLIAEASYLCNSLSIFALATLKKYLL